MRSGARLRHDVISRSMRTTLADRDNGLTLAKVLSVSSLHGLRRGSPSSFLCELDGEPLSADVGPMRISRRVEYMGG